MTAVRDALSLPRRQVVGFFRGLSLPFRGAKLVYVEHPDLVRFWIVPLLVTIAVLVASTAAVFHYDDALLGWLWSDPGAGEGFSGWLLGALHDVLGFVIDVLLLLLALLVTILVGSLVAAPFNARLAEVLDERVTGQKPPPFALGRVAMDLVRTAVIETGFGLVNLVLFVAGLALPPAGPFLFVLGLVAWAYYFAIAYVDVPLATRGKGVMDRLRFSAGHPMAVLGYGTGVGLFLMVPVVNLLFMPAAVAGGVLLVSELERSESPHPASSH
jgi:CysZ protein